MEARREEERRLFSANPLSANPLSANPLSQRLGSTAILFTVSNHAIAHSTSSESALVVRCSLLISIDLYCSLLHACAVRVSQRRLVRGRIRSFGAIGMSVVDMSVAVDLC